MVNAGRKRKKKPLNSSRPVTRSRFTVKETVVEAVPQPCYHVETDPKDFSVTTPQQPSPPPDPKDFSVATPQKPSPPPAPPYIPNSTGHWTAECRSPPGLTASMSAPLVATPQQASRPRPPTYSTSQSGRQELQCNMAFQEELLNRAHHDRNVRVYVEITKLLEVKTAENWFKCEFLVKALWNEPKLGAGNHKNHSDMEFDLFEKPPYLEIRKLWTPRLCFGNLLDVDKESEEKLYSVGNRITGCNGKEVKYRWTGIGTFVENFELASFPWDAQDLSIEIYSQRETDLRYMSRSSENTSLKEATGVIQFYDRGTRLDAIAADYSVCANILVYKNDCSNSKATDGSPFNALRFCAKIIRKPTFYVWSLLVPQFLLVLISLLTVALPSSEMSTRLDTANNMLLATMASKFVLAEHQGRTSDFTFLDKHVVCCCLVLAFVSISNMLRWRFVLGDGTVSPDGENFVYWLDSLSWCFLVFWVLLNVVVFCFPLFRGIPRTEMEKFSMGCTFEFPKVQSKRNTTKLIK